MKLIVILGAALLCFTTSAFSKLTVEDIEKIRSIVKEETTASETRVKEYISQEIAKVNIKIEEMDKRLTGEIKTLGQTVGSALYAGAGVDSFHCCGHRRAADYRRNAGKKSTCTRRKKLKHSKNRLKPCSWRWKHANRNTLGLKLHHQLRHQIPDGVGK